MEFDPKFIWAPYVQLYSLDETPQLSPPPRNLGSYTRALLVSQDRRHLFETPWKKTHAHKPWLELAPATSHRQLAHPDCPPTLPLFFSGRRLPILADGRVCGGGEPNPLGAMSMVFFLLLFYDTNLLRECHLVAGDQPLFNIDL
jgi:hypothetical protein